MSSTDLHAPDLVTHQTDIGAVHLPGSYEYDADRQTYTIAGAGANIWGERDSFHFVWRRMRGNFIVTMSAEFIGAGTNPHRKFGWMARASLDANAPEICTGIHGDGLLSLQFRRTPEAITEEVKADLVGADVIQLERQGNTYSMSVAQWRAGIHECPVLVTRRKKDRVREQRCPV